MNVNEILFSVLIIWNIITFALMAIDKGKAENKEYRISEKTLFTSAFLFGGLGIWLGMSIFRHKTKHNSFRIIIPISIATNIITVGYFLIGTR